CVIALSYGCSKSFASNDSAGVTYRRTGPAATMVENHHYHTGLVPVGRGEKTAAGRRGAAYCGPRGHTPTRSAQTYRNHRGIHSYGAQCDVPPRTAVW